MNTKCLDQAQRYLAMREHNRNELRTKLSGKSYPEDEISEVLSCLEEKGYLCESRYVQSFVRSSNRRHPEGKHMVLMRLLSKGTDRQVALEVLDMMYDDAYVSSLLEEASQKLSRHGKNATREALLKLGFSVSEVNKHLSK